MHWTVSYLSSGILSSFQSACAYVLWQAIQVRNGAGRSPLDIFSNIFSLPNYLLFSLSSFFLSFIFLKFFFFSSNGNYT